jgi:GDPmannose 4,6-dehydratase
MFGNNPNPPPQGFNEDSKLMPASPYACAKVFAHSLVRNYRDSYGMHVSSGILFNHESPRRGETFVTRKITMAAARIKLGLQSKLCLGNLDSQRDWGHAKDYVEAMWAMLQQPDPDDYVIATGECYSVKEFLEEVFTYAGMDPYEYLDIDERLFRPQEVPYLLGDSSKARAKLGWKPKYTFSSLVREMYDVDSKKVEGYL